MQCSKQRAPGGLLHVTQCWVAVGELPRACAGCTMLLMLAIIDIDIFTFSRALFAVPLSWRSKLLRGAFTRRAVKL